MNVTVIKCESSIRTSVGNRDAYVVRVQPKSGKEFVARIIDEYPNSSDVSLISVAKDDAVFSVAIRRTPYCDSEANRTDSVDQMRCFQVVHGSWRQPKSIEDQWWK